MIHRRVRRYAWLLAVAVMLVAGAAEAKPRRRDAKVAFDRGVTAYQKGNFEGASEALGRSFSLERDVDTLFAWAQSERKLEHYDKAIELYEKLLALNLPAANRTVIEANLDECRAMAALQKPKPEAVPVEAKPAEPLAQEPRPPPATEAAPIAERPAAPVQAPGTDTSSAARPWYKDPVALGLGGLGVVATGVGVGLLISANSLGSDSKAATDDYGRALDLRNQARTRGNIGGATAAVGAVALIGAAVWIVVHRKPGEQAVTGWLAPGGGGLAVAGGF